MKCSQRSISSRRHPALADRGQALWTATVVVWTLLCLSAPLAADHPTRLPIGDPERREKSAPVRLDAVTDTHDASLVDPRDLPSRLASTRLLLVGESHTSEEFHRVQEIVLRRLQESGRQVIIGLEMLPSSLQAPLDRWTAGEVSEAEFLDSAQWYEHWGYTWEYYRPIFQLARLHKIAMRGLNVPRDLVSRVRSEGFESLSDEERALLPPTIEPPNDDFRRLFLSHFDDDSGMHAMDGDMLDGFLQSQTAWDASMAWSAVRVLKQQPEAILVVLVGSGHVAYGLGIQRQAEPWLEGPVATLIPVPVSRDGDTVESISASYADFIWGVAEEQWNRFPSLGIATRAHDGGGRTVLFVDDQSPAKALDLEAGDRLLTADGISLKSSGTWRRILAEKHWGESVDLTWQRGEQTFSDRVHLRRSPDDPDSSEPEDAAPSETEAVEPSPPTADDQEPEP